MHPNQAAPYGHTGSPNTELAPRETLQSATVTNGNETQHTHTDSVRPPGRYQARARLNPPPRHQPADFVNPDAELAHTPPPRHPLHATEWSAGDSNP